MRLIAYKTPKIVDAQPLQDVVRSAVPALAPGSIVAITSKIVSICQGNVVSKQHANKRDLIAKHADYMLPPTNKYGYNLTITANTLVAAAGIDESNADGRFVLWPKNVQHVAHIMRQFLAKQYNVGDVGVIIVDSVSMPLRLGTTGTVLAWSGFTALRDYRRTPDLFGRPFAVERANIAQGLAAAAVTVMGEGAEQTPIAVIDDIGFVNFDATAPSAQELADFFVPPEDDLFWPLIGLADWSKNK